MTYITAMLRFALIRTGAPLLQIWGFWSKWASGSYEH